MSPIGKTKDVGYQFGVRKTFPVPSKKLWDFLLSPKGLKIWLGDSPTSLELNQEFITSDEVKGMVRVFQPYSHLRMSWQGKDWLNSSTVQLRVIDKDDKATVSFHQEKLHDAQQRDQVKKYWNKIIDNLEAQIQKEINSKP